ncbi:MAG TPA: hypothetical protein VFL83_09900 [Anaeromyxobacter sp.]|nr:hypothetical protein [Anaeromyxobacter sp.]
MQTASVEPSVTATPATARRRQIRHRAIVVEVETPDSADLAEALAGELVAGMAVIACKVIAEEQHESMSEPGGYYEYEQPRPARARA